MKTQLTFNSSYLTVKNVIFEGSSTTIEVTLNSGNPVITPFVIKKCSFNFPIGVFVLQNEICFTFYTHWSKLKMVLDKIDTPQCQHFPFIWT